MACGVLEGEAMAEPPVLLGIDVGTTGCKVVVSDLEARILGIGAAPYRVHTPRPSWAEQEVTALWEGVVHAVREAMAAVQVAPSRVRALSLSGALHSILPVDAAGQPLTPALIWADARSAEHVRRLRAEVDPGALYRRTGCPLQAMYPLAKLVWLRQALPEAFRKAHVFLSIKDYIVRRLTGEFIADYAIASGSGLMDIGRLRWDRAALDLAGVVEERLPLLSAPETQIDGLQAEAAEALGLPRGVTVVLGGSDGALANIGAGAVTPGRAALTIGSSGAMRVVTAEPLTHPKEHTWCYLVDAGAYLVGGAINNGGIVLDWLYDTFSETGGRDVEQEAAAALPPGAEGLLFLPYLNGERCPHWNADARGVIFGLSMRHGRGHLVRATMEGVAFRMYSIFRALTELTDIAEVRASGGFIRSPLWLQIVADVMGREIVLPDTQEMSGVGAVFVAMKALGLVGTLADAARLVNVGRGAVPNMDHHALYERLFAQFESVYAHLRDDFAALAAFRAGV